MPRIAPPNNSKCSNFGNEIEIKRISHIFSAMTSVSAVDVVSFFYFFVMCWTLALPPKVNVTHSKVVVDFWEYCVCLNFYFIHVLIFNEVLIDEAFVALLTRRHSTFKVIRYCFIFRLIVFIVAFHYLFGSMCYRAKESVLNAESVSRLHCPFQNCGKFYKNKMS